MGAPSRRASTLLTVLVLLGATLLAGTPSTAHPVPAQVLATTPAAGEVVDPGAVDVWVLVEGGGVDLQVRVAGRTVTSAAADDPAGPPATAPVWAQPTTSPHEPPDQPATEQPASDQLGSDQPATDHGATDHDRDRPRVLHTRVDLPPGDHLGEVLVDGAVVHLWRFTVATHPLDRITGTDVVDTSARLAARTHTDASAPAAVLVRADGVADALAGVALAARVGGPLLATTGDALSPATGEALDRALAPGGTVHLLGGTAALADAVAEDVTDRGFVVVRHAGVDRHATAALAAGVTTDGTTPDDTGPDGTAPDDTGPDDTGQVTSSPAPAFLVSGTAVADALAASTVAALAGAPILLAGPDALPGPTLEALRAGGHGQVTVVGGTAVIGDAVLEALLDEGISVRRIAGTDRFATAAALARGTAFPGTGVALASSAGPLAALLAAAHAAHLGQPLLLADGDRLTGDTREALTHLAPGPVTVHGPVPLHVARTARALLLDAGTGGVARMAPEPGTLLTGAPLATIDVDAPLRAAGLAVAVTVGGHPVPATVTVTDDRTGVAVAVAVAAPGRTPGPAAWEVRVVALLPVGEGDGWAHADWTFRIPPHDRRYATADGIDLFEPSPDVEVIGYHQSSHRGSRPQTALANGTPSTVMGSRGRGTDRTSAADIVANPALPVLAPATGTVVRAGTYLLYCEDPDHFLVIDPDQRPGWEVKLLHFEGLAVAVGDRVVGGETVVGSAPRQLPFTSQVDHLSGPANWPHLHVEVVDPAVPTPPGGSC